MKAFNVRFFIITILFVSSIGVIQSNAQTMVQWYTSEGDFNVQLREDLVPITAQNFIDLTNARFYDSLLFHRVISGFMIQDGCPYGDGTGDAGYTFNDEFHADLNHNEAGILSMGNSGPNTNGSQYFITVAPTTWLNNLHSVFGKVIDGLDVVIAISEVPTNANDRPLVDVRIDSIRVITTGTRTLALVSPKAGDIFLANQDQLISWDSEFVADVNIEFSIDNGLNWVLIADSISCNAKSFEWQTPDSLATQCKIKISDATNPMLNDESPTFSLGKLDVTAPFLGTYLGGQELEIAWTSEAIPFIGLAYQDTINGPWYVIVDSIASSVGSYNWLVPMKASNKYKLRAFVANTPSAYDLSVGNVRVCLLDLLTPAGGEQYTIDSLISIKWSSQNINKLTLEYTIDNGSSWLEIAPEVLPWDSTYQWNVPTTLSDSCFVKVYYKGKPQLYKMNGTPFSIVELAGAEEVNAADAYHFIISPNPASNNIRISYELNSALSNVEVSIYNMNGKAIASLINKKQTAGKYNLQYNVSKLKPGMYLFVLKINEQTMAQQFVKE